MSGPLFSLLARRRSGTGSLQVRIDGFGSRASTDTLGGSAVGWSDARENKLFFLGPA